MPVYTDQTGRKIDIPAMPRRIVSLVPSQTEFLYDLGLDAEVVGITKFCVHPGSWFRSKPRVGGTKTVHIEQVLALQPDLVIANKEENTSEQVLALAEQLPVWTSDIANLDQAMDMMTAIADITGREEKGKIICKDISEAFHRLTTGDCPPALKTAYLIWKDPFMTVGGDTFIHDMLWRCGFLNIFGTGSRYPETSMAELKAAGVELLLLSSEPYPFGEKHLESLRADLPDTIILLADGEFFSWYGSRLRNAPAYFNTLRKIINDRTCRNIT